MPKMRAVLPVGSAVEDMHSRYSLAALLPARAKRGKGAAAPPDRSKFRARAATGCHNAAVVDAMEPARLTASSAAPGVSISYVITVYNKRQFLPQVIAGLAAQRGDFAREFVFVDDGSTDGSAEEIERLTQGWPELRIIRQTNHGSS